MTTKNMLCKGISVVLIMVLFLQKMPFAASYNTVDATAETYYYGDLDNDKKLTVFDLIIMKRCFISQSEMTEIQLEQCDLDKSAEFDQADLKMLQDYLLKKIHSFPAGTSF
ncbi:MAG: dockerin type I repeat-containing protein, partial [Porcipelethomonas sp.]